MIETTELLFHGRAMTAEPSNISLSDVVDLLLDGSVAVVLLEPGDGTRYDLVLAPIGDDDDVRQLAVTRTEGGSGGDWRSGALLVNPRDADPESTEGELRRLAGSADPIALPNEWTVTLFTWWFTLLWDALNG